MSWGDSDSKVKLNMFVSVDFRCHWGVFVLIFAIFTSCQKETTFRVADIVVLEHPAEEGSRYPHLSTNSDNTMVWMSWMEPMEHGYDLKVSGFDGIKWTNSETVVSGNSFFTNWADFPSVITHDGLPIAAHWLKKVEGGPYAYHVQIAFRNIDGTWGEPITPHLDNTPTEHGFVSMLPVDDDRVLAVWLDGRNTDPAAHSMHSMHERTAESEHNGHDVEDPENAMTLRSAIIHRDGTISDKRVIDNSVCDCCQTSITRSGDYFVVAYRNRTGSEIRDIYVSSYSLSNGEWSKPLAVSDDGWEIGGCPVNGPQIISDGYRVVVAWFTGAENQARSFIAISRDHGHTFGPRISIDDGSSMGRVGLTGSQDGHAWVSWISAGERPAKLYVREIGRTDKLGPKFVVAEMDPSRGSGFPRMAYLSSDRGRQLIVGWTEPRPVHQVKVSEVTLAN